ncbi:hypothetical protein D1871_17980 [Nakamurella silvestris]|nr:hypothetical protein D1871_17980 [Nakamurella silvestris]
MTTPRRRAPLRPANRIRPSQIVTVVVLVAALIGAAVLGGVLGGLIIALVATAAALLLALRWNVLDHRIRILRLVAVLAVYAVAISVMARG